jgi:hypothetical protein
VTVVVVEDHFVRCNSILGVPCPYMYMYIVSYTYLVCSG